MAKIHLAKAQGAGGRSACRYTARPSRRVHLLPLAQFVLLPKSSQCNECAAQAAAIQQVSPRQIDVFHLEPDQEVHCYYCLRDGERRLYKRGEAFLADAGHSPCNGEANFICCRHLDEGAVVYEPHPAQRPETLEKDENPELEQPGATHLANMALAPGHAPAPDFDAFWRDWADYVLSLNDMDDDTARAAYHKAYAKIQALANQPLWRGMSVNDEWLGGWEQNPVGLYWSEDEEVARTFQTAVSVYDERFSGLEGATRPHQVLLKVLAPLESIDVPGTIAAQLASAEGEIRLLEGASLQLLALVINGNAVASDRTCVA